LGLGMNATSARAAKQSSKKGKKRNNSGDREGDFGVKRVLWGDRFWADGYFAGTGAALTKRSCANTKGNNGGNDARSCQ